MHAPAKLVLFDIDGTLLNSKGLGRRVMKSALLAAFGTYGRLDQCAVGGRSYLQIVEDALAGTPISHDQILQNWTAYNEQIVQELETVIAREPGWIYTLPGGVQLVRTLAANPAIVLGLVTGNPPGPSWIKLAAAGYDREWFKINVFGDEAPTRAGLVALARRRAFEEYQAQFEGTATVVIGDTVNDVECAREAGARNIIVLNGYDREEAIRLAQPDFVFSDLTDVPAILSAIFAPA